jgi:transposase
VEAQHGAYQLYVGIDVAAETFVAAWLAPEGQPTAPITGEQTAAGFAALVHRLQGTGVSPAAALVVLEATSAYWVALAVALHEAGYQVAVINPRQAHHFFKAQLRRAKTDALDARDLARLAAALRPAPWMPPPAIYHEVRQRLVARDGLLALRTQARNQRHVYGFPSSAPRRFPHPCPRRIRRLVGDESAWRCAPGALAPARAPASRSPRAEACRPAGP